MTVIVSASKMNKAYMSHIDYSSHVIYYHITKRTKKTGWLAMRLASSVHSFQPMFTRLRKNRSMFAKLNSYFHLHSLQSLTTFQPVQNYMTFLWLFTRTWLRYVPVFAIANPFVCL